MTHCPMLALFLYGATRIWLFARGSDPGYMLSDGTRMCFGPADLQLRERIASLER